MRFIPTRIHGVLDYLVGALLIAAPWLLNFDRGGAETWVPVILGVGALLYSLFTDYELGLVRRLSMSTHLGLETPPAGFCWPRHPGCSGLVRWSSGPTLFWDFSRCWRR